VVALEVLVVRRLEQHRLARQIVDRRHHHRMKAFTEHALAEKVLGLQQLGKRR